MLAHRKCRLTLSDGPEAVPSVGFPVRPLRRGRLEMPHIAGAPSPVGRTGKPISVNPNTGDTL